MRVSYGQEQKAYDCLTAQKFPVFLPKQYKENKLTGKKELVNAIKNVLFVHATVREMREYIGSIELPYFHHFYQTQTDTDRRLNVPRIPIVIPDKQMETFMRWFNADEADKYFRTKEYKCFEGDKVRIIGGKFIGMIGHIVTIAGHRRVGVNIDHLGFIATSYIPRNLIEPYNESKTYRRIWLLSFWKQNHQTGTLSKHQECILYSAEDLNAWTQEVKITTELFFKDTVEIDTIFSGYAFNRTYNSVDAKTSLHLSIIPYDIAPGQDTIHIFYHYGIKSPELTTILFNNKDEATNRFKHITGLATKPDVFCWEQPHDSTHTPSSCAGILTLAIKQ